MILGVTRRAVLLAAGVLAATPRPTGAVVRLEPSADSTAALAAASAEAAAGGRVVELPPGVTTLQGPGTWAAGVTYRGADSTSSVRVLPQAGEGLVIDQPGVVLAGLRFTREDGSAPFIRVRAARARFSACGFSDSGAAAAPGVVVDPGADQAVFTGCRFESIGSTSLLIDSAARCRIADSAVLAQRYTAGTQSAIQLSGAADGTRVERTVVEIDPALSTAMNGIGLSGADLLIRDNLFSVSRFAVEAGTGVSGTVERNLCVVSSTPERDGLNYAAGISLPHTRGLVVRGNVVDQSAATRTVWVGIELPDAQGCVVTGNTVHGSPLGSQAIILDAASGCTVRGNRILGAPSGITVYGHAAAADRNVIEANDIAFSGTGRDWGVAVLLDATGSATGNRITGNTIRGGGGARTAGVLLDVQVGSGAIADTVVTGNDVTGVGTDLARRGDAGTVL